MIKAGLDIVYIPKIRRLMQNKNFIRKVFHKSEIKNFTAEHLAGIFAVKEAFFKALGKKINWHLIEIKKEKSGKPKINFSNEIKKNLKNTSIEISISHEKDYAIALVFIFGKIKY